MKKQILTVGIFALSIALAGCERSNDPASTGGTDAGYTGTGTTSGSTNDESVSTSTDTDANRVAPNPTTMDDNSMGAAGTSGTGSSSTPSSNGSGTR